MKLTGFFRGLLCASLMTGSAVMALAGETTFDQRKFDTALAAGGPVIVDFSASWCPTCKAQRPIVVGLMAQPRFKDIDLFVADYDKEVALKRAMRITQQSTFVVFRNGKEVTRSTGQTDKDVLTAVFQKAL